MKTTIERGIEQNYIKSVRIILKHIFENINKFQYTHLIMADLPVILKSKKIIINDFFERSSMERMRYERAQEGFCNMEIPLNKLDLPIFSNL